MAKIIFTCLLFFFAASQSSATNVCGQVFAVEPKGQNRPFTLTALISLLKSSEKIMTVEDLILLLPEELRGNFTLMKNSQSLQESDAENPRAILFSDNLVVAFNGNPAQRAYNTAEIFGFNEENGHFELRQISFSADTKQQGQTWEAKALGLGQQEIEYLSSRVAISSANPKKCMGCHSSGIANLPRPIWDDYDLWPTAFGGVDDGLHLNSLSSKKQNEDLNRERMQFLTFKNSMAKRYQALLFDHTNQFYPFHGDLSQKEFDFQSHPDRTIYTMPNTRLLLILSYNYAQELAQKVFALPEFKMIQYSFLARVMESDPNLIPKNLIAHIYAEFEKTFNLYDWLKQVNYPRFTREPNKFFEKIPGLEGPDSVVAYRTGIDVPGKIIPFGEPTQLSNFVQKQLIDLIIENDPELLKFFELNDDYRYPVQFKSPSSNAMIPAARSALATFYEPKDLTGLRDYLFKQIKSEMHKLKKGSSKVSNKSLSHYHLEG